MLNASIVLYNSNFDEVKLLVNTLREAKCVIAIYLIDNSPVQNELFGTLDAEYIFTHKNIGYGAAHNIALRKSIAEKVDYHLVVNPDILFDAQIMEKIVEFMNKNAIIGHLMPKILFPNGQIQYLCKLLPTPFDLIFRRFLPESWTKKRTEKFELRQTNYDKVMDVPYLSGCFMFLRVSTLAKVGLFDERFFMYPEDIDLTRRIHAKYRTVFYPEVVAIHNHARDSYKNPRMLWVHIRNMLKYFNKWGWFFDNERKEINRRILILLNKIDLQ